MVGRTLAASARRQGRDVLALTAADWDITDPLAAERFIDSGDVVINCAAYTQVDTAEQEPERAHAVNALGPDGVDGVRPLLVVLGGVDLGVGRAVDHDVTGLNEPLGRRRVGDIPLRRRQRQHVAALPTCLTCQRAPQHATGAGDNDSV